MSELQPILDLLSGKSGWVATALTWIAALKTASTLIETRVAHFLADRLNDIAATESEDDDKYLRWLFEKPAYKMTAFVLRLVGVRLPTLADLERALRLQSESKIKP